MVTPIPDAESELVGQEPLCRLSKLAQEDPARKFSSIAHLLTPQSLLEAFTSLSRQASAGVDEVTYRDYELQASQNVRRLWERLRNGTYRAQPLRRIYIPKEDGKQRAISIPALEDKIVQKATVRLLKCDLRDGLSGLLLWCAAGTQCPPGARRAGSGDLSPVHLARAGTGHRLLLRRHCEK